MIDPPYTFKDWNRDHLMRLADELAGDGHSIVSPFKLAEHLDLNPAESVYLGSLSTTHYSHQTEYKQQISDPDTGKPVASLFGLYALTMYQRMAEDLNVKYEPKLGRGSQAQAILSALRAHWQKETSHHGAVQ